MHPEKVDGDAIIEDPAYPHQAYSTEEVSLVTINVDGLLSECTWKHSLNIQVASCVACHISGRFSRCVDTFIYSYT